MTGSPASRITDPTPVDAEHIANQLRGNFPEDAIRWVFHGHWIGPVNIPWSRVDTDDEGKWAASHQPGAVARFKRKILARNGKVKPSILIQGHDGDRAVVIDGHHRALAHHELGRPVRAYVGTIRGRKWIDQALEAHSRQEHSGSDPRNKSAQTPELESTPDPLGPNGLWRTPSKKVPEKQHLPFYVQHIADALRRSGMEESQAIATAIQAVRRWARGGGKVHPEVRAAARRAVAEWEHLKETHR